jgi:hypothetical protein
MPDEVKYGVLKVVPRGIDLAKSRHPRLQPTVAEEYGDMLSREVAASRWTIDPENGEPLNSAGQTLVQHLEFTLSTRPHWLMPAVLEDEAEAVWLAETPSLSVRGKRLQQLERHIGSKAAALVAFKEEAARFGITNPMSLQQGSKPGSDKGDGKKPAANLSENPWSQQFRGDEIARAAKIASIIKTGTKFAEGLAKAAGTTVGRPLRK